MTFDCIYNELMDSVAKELSPNTLRQLKELIEEETKGHNLNSAATPHSVFTTKLHSALRVEETRRDMAALEQSRVRLTRSVELARLTARSFRMAEKIRDGKW